MTNIPPDISKEYKFVNGGLIVLLLILALIPIFTDIAELSKENNIKIFRPPDCFVKQSTGQLCSGCGLTRSVVSLCQGDWKSSIDYHPAGILLIIFIFLELILTHLRQ